VICWLFILLEVGGVTQVDLSHFNVFDVVSLFIDWEKRGGDGIIDRGLNYLLA
jgi:hypothetical protein